jgi:hypothetical protein
LAEVSKKMNVAELQNLLLANFAENWTYCPIIWDTQNVNQDIDKVLADSDPQIIVSPFTEFLSITPLEIPVTLSMRQVEFVINLLLAEPEGGGNKSTLEAIDEVNAIYTSKSVRLSKSGIEGFASVDFGEVEMASSELIQGKYLTMAMISGIALY